jgi:hypothetical protein
MSLNSSVSISRVRSIAIAGLAVLAGAGVMGAGSAHAATTSAIPPMYQQASSTFASAGIAAPVQSVGGGGFQSVGGGSQDTGSGVPSCIDPALCVTIFQTPHQL